MASALRKKRKAGSEARAQDHECPICMERTERDRVCFPCGHFVCAPCDSRMLANGFLSCPTCRAPREGVSQRQVDAANRARAERHAAQDGERSLVLRAGEREVRVMFFPDESVGGDPFGPLARAPRPGGGSRNEAENDHLLAQAIEAAAAVQSALPHLAEPLGPQLRLEQPMRQLVERLLRPGTVRDFLAQREAVRASQRPGRRRRSAERETRL